MDPDCLNCGEDSEEWVPAYGSAMAGTKPTDAELGAQREGLAFVAGYVAHK